MTDSLNRKRQISDPFQREAEQIMKRCQRGTRNYEEANNLHAACYAIIGKLLAQPEQEPVAKVVCNSAGQISMQTLDGNSFDISKYVGSMFYTTPPQRTWVGLTDEEENEYNYLGPDMHWVIQEIAAKLKEKNT